MILRIKRIFESLFPAHSWEHSKDGSTRTCSVCRRVEDFDPGDGMSGSAWLTVERGNRKAHWVGRGVMD